jgi:hypothetical protein
MRELLMILQRVRKEFGAVAHGSACFVLTGPRAATYVTRLTQPVRRPCMRV